MTVIKKFIEENKISFEEGTRNNSVTTLIGYALHLGLDVSDLIIELEDQIKEDGFIEDEILRLWGYCKDRNYGNWWENEKNRKTFII
jgi:hypothetical protein